MAQAISPWKAEWLYVKTIYKTAFKWLIRVLMVTPILLLIITNVYVLFSIGYCIYYPEMLVAVPINGMQAVPNYTHYALKRIVNYVVAELSR